MQRRKNYCFQLALTADEGRGYRGAKILVDQGFFDKTDFLIITEPTNLQVAVGEKGELNLPGEDCPLAVFIERDNLISYYVK